MKWIISIVLLIGIFAIAITQFSIPTLWGADGYYHMHLANLMRTQGIIRDFSWAKYSFFATHFSDKDLLYHLLLVPFTLFPKFFFGAKVASCVFAISLFLLFFALLKRYCSERFIPCFLILFLISDHFLFALSSPRSMVLAIAFMILGIHFLIKKNSWGIFLTTLLYGYLHITALMMLFFAALVETLRFFRNREEREELEASLHSRRFLVKPIVLTGLALTLSYLLHPHFPNNLLFIHLNLFMVPYYAAKGGILELGAEFFPMNTRDFFLSYPAIFPGILILIFFAMKQVHKIRFETEVLFACSVPFFIGAFFSQRYMIHGYPLLLLWWGSHFSDLYRQKSDPLQGRLPAFLGREGRGEGAPHSLPVRVDWSLISRSWLSLLLIIGLFSGSILTVQRVKKRAFSEKFVNSHYERMGQWMRQNIPPGETIFHANWSDSQYFIGLNPQNSYFVTLDPIYMYAWNQQLYKLYRDLAHGRVKDPYDLLKNTFKVRYGYAGKMYFSNLIRQIMRDGRIKILAEDSLGIIFRLKKS